MTAFIAFVTANIGAILAIIGALAGAFAIVAKLTPTPKDDKVAAAILNFLNLLPTTAKATYEARKAEKKGPTPIVGA